MAQMPAMRTFTLRPEGVHCGPNGPFVGSVPLLLRARDSYGRERWSPRPTSKLDNELTVRYGLPISVADKVGRLASIARALDSGDLALAGIGAVLLGFPDPPPLGKGLPTANDWMALAVELAASRLLKSDWDPGKHPRTGEKPNPGWFAEVAREVQEVSARMRAWPSPRFNKALRELVKDVAERGGLSELGPYGDAVALVWELAQQLGPSALNDGEQRAIEQTNAYFDPPKTLEELQARPTQNVLGYERHHVVEQNDDNVEKEAVAKFGRDALDNPKNLVWAPRLKHELITGYYNEIDLGDLQGRSRRDVIGEDDFEIQRDKGLAVLRKFGVLE